MCEAVDLCGQSGEGDGTLKESDDVNHLKMGVRRERWRGTRESEEIKFITHT